MSSEYTESKAAAIKRQRLTKLKQIKTLSRSSTSTSTSEDSLSSTRVSQNTLKVIPKKDSQEYLEQLVRKIFYPTTDCSEYNEILPALTSNSNVDIELYALVGLLFKQFIQGWYNALTDDQEFINELIGVTAHFCRDLEGRLDKIDLIQLILDDIPFILNKHLNAYNRAKHELNSSFLPYDDIGKAFDKINPHFALTDQEEDANNYLKILSRHIMVFTLPNEEMCSSLVTNFINALMSDLLLSNIIEKLIQPYTIFEIISLICELLINHPSSSEKQNSEPTISSLRHTIVKIKLLASETSIQQSATKVSALQIFPFLDNLLLISTYRPMLYGVLRSSELLLNTRKINNSVLNMINNILSDVMRQPSLVSLIIQKLRNNLFPTDENMGPPRQTPDDQEVENIKKQSKSDLERLFRKFGLLSKIFINSEESGLGEAIDNFLAGFENERINKHLVYNLLDLIVLRLFPELDKEFQK